MSELLGAANRRYLEFISSLDDPTVAMNILDRVTLAVHDQGRSHKGLNFFAAEDLRLLEAVVQGEHNVSGMRNRTIRNYLPELTSARISRHLKRLRLHGLIKRVGRTYKYYLTRLGRRVVAMALKLRALVIIPQLARN